MKALRSSDGVQFVGREAKVFNLMLPCRQCAGCRMAHSREWALRIMHEASLHPQNCFITLTFSEEYLKPSLDYTDFQQFMKRFRKKHGKLRFYMCGEYGSDHNRPHYHACIFGFDFADKTLWQRKKSGNLYRSKSLEQLWPYGFSSIGDLTFESAAYVSRYILKKINGGLAKEHYSRTDSETGEITEITPEFTRMSLKPGIGATWFEKFQSDIFPHDYVIQNGHKKPVPRYYTKKYLKGLTDEEVKEFESHREKKLETYRKENTPARRKARAEILKSKLKNFKRNL